MRMLALAQAWRRRGGNVHFLCCQCPEGIRARLEEAGFPPRMIDAEPGSDGDRFALEWAIAESPGAAVALDGYHFGTEYQEKIRPQAKRLLVVDDCGHLDRYCADVLLNQNPSADRLNLGARAGDAMVLAGTKFALLREEYLPWRGHRKAVKEVPLNVLLTMGGADPDNVTLKVIGALKQLSAQVAELRVLAGGANPHVPPLRAALAPAPFPAQLLENARDVPTQLAWADAAVAAAGSTCWELAFLGVPFAVIVLAENQLEIAEVLDQEGAAFNVGWHTELEGETLTSKLDRFLQDAPRRAAMRMRIRDLVDGEGADRVINVLEGRDV